MIKQFLASDFCLKCKGCCRFSEQDSAWLPTLLDEEKEYGGKDKKIKAVPLGEGLNCFFLSPAEHKCKIYAQRPFECQLYPFLINRRAKGVFLAVDLNCPFASGHLNQPEFQKYSDYLKDFLKSPEQLEIFKRNPQILQSYEGVSDLLPLEIEP